MKRLVLDGGSLPWTVIFAVIHNQRHDLSTLADNNGIEFLSNKGNKRERKRTEHSQSMLGQTCSDLVRLVQASLCNLKRSTPRTVSSLMMSPDKGSPFNSRWEVGVGRRGKSKQTSSSHQLSLSYHKIGWNNDSPADCRVCQGRPAPLKDEPPRSASTAPASRAWNTSQICGNGALLLSTQWPVFFRLPIGSPCLFQMREMFNGTCFILGSWNIFMWVI